jgi:hypothetical protein
MKKQILYWREEEKLQATYGLALWRREVGTIGSSSLLCSISGGKLGIEL